VTLLAATKHHHIPAELSGRGTAAAALPRGTFSRERTPTLSSAQSNTTASPRSSRQTPGSGRKPSDVKTVSMRGDVDLVYSLRGDVDLVYSSAGRRRPGYSLRGDVYLVYSLAGSRIPGLQSAGRRIPGLHLRGDVYLVYSLRGDVYLVYSLRGDVDLVYSLRGDVDLVLHSRSALRKEDTLLTDLAGLRCNVVTFCSSAAGAWVAVLSLNTHCQPIEHNETLCTQALSDDMP
ncbi:hypothetical protein KUCAC02_019398, partial [Chaenocephalus aceratus]